MALCYKLDKPDTFWFLFGGSVADALVTEKEGETTRTKSTGTSLQPRPTSREHIHGAVLRFSQSLSKLTMPAYFWISTTPSSHECCRTSCVRSSCENTQPRCHTSALKHPAFQALLFA